ncbi:MAG: hypothetical protein E6X86_12000 [Clostridium butyricum]|nr:hypothetical protein [Clostridium butyricum]MDU4855417.1 hypothetical protein [Clostridioides difficile]
MKLELTLSKEAISKYFSILMTDKNARLRICNNILVTSNELVENWSVFLEKINLKEQFEQWFYTEAISTEQYIKKVEIIEATDENDIIIKTCDSSRDKIIVADNNIIPANKRNSFKFVSNVDFNKDKCQRIKVQDIEKVYCRNICNDIFSLYEEPIVIDVSLNSNSKVLAEYLSKFYENTFQFIIRDMYLCNTENLRNFQKYILPYLDKQNCNIIIQLHWDNSNDKNRMESIFNNMLGYNIKLINISNEKYMHESFIESDEYKFNIGYRMRLFGDIDDGLTEQDLITITKK